MVELRVVALVLAAWIVGVAAYGVALFGFFGEIMTMDSPDFTAMLFWSAMAFGLSAAVFHLPILFLVRRLFPDANIVAYGAVGCILGVVPVFALLLLWGGISRDALTSPEILLFLCLFLAAGTTLGLGFRRAVPPGT